MTERERYLIKPAEILAYGLLEEIGQKGQCNKNLLTLVMDQLPTNSALRILLENAQKENSLKVQP